MSDQLKQYLCNGTIRLPSGRNFKVSDSVQPREGLYIQSLIKLVKPKVALEVGLGSGISALFILEMMRKCRGKKLISIDPFQFGDKVGKTNEYGGRGVYVIKKSGFKKMFRFYNDTSQQVLPRLVSKNTKIGFAFIDGYHTFDHSLVDFFYIDKILKVGGVAVFHDIVFPSIKSLCSFIELNRSYKKLRIPRQFDTGNIVAFKKLKNDDRSWDHFVFFWEPKGLMNTLLHIPVLMKNAISRRIGDLRISGKQRR